MNPVVIILGILVIVLLYFLYLYYFKTVTLVQLVDLKTQYPKIPFKDLDNPSSTNFALGVWIYINNWDNSKWKVLYQSNFINVVIGDTKPILYAVFRGINNGDQWITALNNVPIQKWTYLLLNVNNNKFVDVYINGKLMNSIVLNIPQNNNSVYGFNKDSNIQIGDNTPNDIFLAKFERWSDSISPQTAWKKYLEGSGVSNSYNAQLSIVQNGNVQAQYSIFN
jgi:hypothetical protein